MIYSPPETGMITYLKVKNIFGYATTIDKQGHVKQLITTSLLLAGEHIETGAGKVELILPDGRVIFLAPHSATMLNRRLMNRAVC